VTEESFSFQEEAGEGDKKTSLFFNHHPPLIVMKGIEDEQACRAPFISGSPPQLCH